MVTFRVCCVAVSRAKVQLLDLERALKFIDKPIGCVGVCTDADQHK